MGRKPTISNDAIIRGAREVFLEAGPGAPTSRIAEACGVSEGTLFKRFGTKESLFAAAMGLPPLEPVIGDILTVRPGETARNRCIRIGGLLVRFFVQVIPRMTTMFASGNLQPGKIFENDPKPPLELLRAVEKMFNSEIQEGRIALDDPEVAARMMLSTSHNLAFFETMGIEPTRTSEEQLEYMARMVNLLRFNEDQKENVCK